MGGGLVVSSSRAERVAYLGRIDTARHELELSREENERLEQLRVQVGQTIDSMHKRAIQSRVVTKEATYGLNAAGGLLARDDLSDWVVDVLTKLHEVEARMSIVQDAVADVDEENREDGNGVDDEEAFEEESRMIDATIESLIVRNECGIRIRPRETAALDEGFKDDEAFILQDFANAAHQLAAAHTRIARAAGGPVVLSREASELPGAGGGGPGGAGGGRTSPKTSPRPVVRSVALRAHPAHAESKDEGEGGAGGGGAGKIGVKPLRTKEIQRYLAAAVTMSGGDVRDDFAIREDGDSDDEVTWEKVKHQSELEKQKHVAQHHHAHHHAGARPARSPSPLSSP
jgi:hypothetical protein